MFKDLIQWLRFKRRIRKYYKNYSKMLKYSKRVMSVGDKKC